MYENLIPLLTKYTSLTATLRLSLLLHNLDCHLVYFDHNTLCNVYVDTSNECVISVGTKHETRLVKYRPLFEYLMRRLRRIREIHLHVANNNTINLEYLSRMNTKFIRVLTIYTEVGQSNEDALLLSLCRKADEMSFCCMECFLPYYHHNLISNIAKTTKFRTVIVRPSGPLSFHNQTIADLFMYSVPPATIMSVVPATLNSARITNSVLVYVFGPYIEQSTAWLHNITEQPDACKMKLYGIKCDHTAYIHMLHCFPKVRLFQLNMYATISGVNFRRLLFEIKQHGRRAAQHVSYCRMPALIDDVSIRQVYDQYDLQPTNASSTMFTIDFDSFHLTLCFVC